jgi:SAM-dependent methyltransferase
MTAEKHPWTPDFMYVDWDRPHLGGYLLGGDPGSYYPALWTWLVRKYRVASVIDVGCGEGQSVAYFRGLGCRVRGIDGIAQDDPDIVQHDYTEAPLATREMFDLCWCCEFVEHVATEYEGNFLATFAHARMVAMTHGLPGQGGHHHVNCQPPAYWIERMRERGFRLNRPATRRARQLTPNGYFDWSGLIFTREDA